MRNTHQHAAQRQHGVFQAVFTQDDHGTLGAQVAGQQRLADASCARQGAAITQVLPVTGAAIGQAFAPRQKRALRCFTRPVQQLVGHAFWVRLQGLLGLHILHTVRCVVQAHPRDAIAHGTVLGRSAHFFSTLAARPCKKASTRALASGAAWVMEDIKDSVTKPWSAACSAMRGRACIKA